ncbi:MAG: SGNH/GDSL hydrolase family protein [Candidatus Aquilonibacter sp.]
MKLSYLARPLAILTLTALAACGGGSSGVGPPAATPVPIVTPAGGTPLVGIGDSLTAGYQSDGFLGQANPLVTSSLSAYPGNAVPPGQENGFWADIYVQLTGVPAASMYVPSTSPLPLIAGPGLGTQLVINRTSLFASIQSGCDPFNDQAYSATAYANTRLANTQNLDLGVPGITMHEAVAMTGPLTGPPNAPNCGYNVLPNDPTSGGLQSLVSGESALFYPVMGAYRNSVSQLTELNVAAALQPKLATVWLGANDVLKFSFSGGNPVASDSPTQMQADLTQIIKTLTAKGTKVLIADLPNVLSSPQFFPQGNRLIADLATLLTPALGSSATAAATAIASYVATQYGVTTGGYLTESGFLAIVQNCGVSPSTCLTPQLDPSGTGSGLGAYYLTPAFATEVAQLNAGYNQVIDAVATGSGPNVALVPITATFNALAPSTTTPGSAPNLDTIQPGAPSATLQFGGNLVSWDGLHPSDLGYAVIANTFIAAADASFSMTIPPITNAQLNAIATADPYNGTNIDAALGEPIFPLP